MYKCWKAPAFAACVPTLPRIPAPVQSNLSTMQSLFPVLLCFLAVLATAAAEELRVDKTFIPEKCDRKSVKGDILQMHYSGFIAEGSAAGIENFMFDSSIPRGKYFDFTLGAGTVIQGWEQGLLDMCIGEKRTLHIPPELGYGAKGSGQLIPGGASLRFTVELFGLGPVEKPNVFAAIDVGGDGKISYEEFEAYFAKHKQGIPQNLWAKEDKNQDQFISWEEFNGPKGLVPPTPKDEL